MKVVILGASGLIGSTIYRVLTSHAEHKVYGTIRTNLLKSKFTKKAQENLISGIDLLSQDSLLQLFLELKPEVVINCAGLTKHLPNSSDYLFALPINSLMPHRVASFCRLIGARFIHISTDCVFSGSKGQYREVDPPDAQDVYGKSKALGEVVDRNSLTIRTSTIGHELSSSHGLLNWFLEQEDRCLGFKNAIFSGIPTVVLASVINNYILSDESLRGLMHVSAQPISKYNLLKLIAEVYGKNVDIYPDDKIKLDRSLDGSLFSSITGFVAPDWPCLIQTMFENR